MQKKRLTDRVVVQHPTLDQLQRKIHPQNPKKLQRFPAQKQKKCDFPPSMIYMSLYFNKISHQENLEHIYYFVSIFRVIICRRAITKKPAFLFNNLKKEKKHFLSNYIKIFETTIQQPLQQLTKIHSQDSNIDIFSKI